MANQTLLDFGSAMAAVKDGKRVSRVEWNNANAFGQMRKDDGRNVNTLQISINGEWHTWAPIVEGDIVAIDWFIVSD